MMTAKRLQEKRTAHNLDRKRKRVLRTRFRKVETFRLYHGQAWGRPGHHKGYFVPDQADEQHAVHNPAVNA
jgi:hypothetical protein